MFARALLVQQCACNHVTRTQRAESLQLACSRPDAHDDCLALWRLAYERARFALRLPTEGQPLPHHQVMRLQCGTLSALQAGLDEPVTDVQDVLALARRRAGSLADLPWAELVPRIAAWQPPRRSGAP